MCSRLLLSVVLLVLALPSAASAAGWVPVATALSTAQSGMTAAPVAASNGQGDSAIAWVDPATTRVFSSERPAGGAFTLGSEVSTLADARLGNVQIDDAGTIYVFFISANSTPASSSAKVATKPLGATSWTVTTLGAADAQDPAQDSIQGRVTPGGRGLAVWFQGHTPDAAQSRVQFSRKAAGATTWSAKASIVGSAITGTTSNHRIALNEAGQGAIVFTRPTCDLNAATQAFGASMSVNGVWTSPNQISACNPNASFATDSVQGTPRVGIDAAGNATAVWAHRVNGASNVVQATTKTSAVPSWPSAAFTGAADLAGGNGPDVAVGTDGTTTVAWTRLPNIFESRTRPAAGGAFAPTQTLPAGTNSANAMALATGADGSVVASWLGEDDGDPEISASARPAGATSFGTARTRPGGQTTSLAVDDQGNAVVTWRSLEPGGTQVVRASGFDLTAPVIGPVEFPATAATGVAFAYGATVTDRWGLGATSWAFGDSTTGALTGSKSYATTGAFTATLTVADAAANTASASRTIDVATPAPTPVPTPVPTPGATPGPGGPTPVPDTLAPTLGAVSLTRTTFRVDRRGASVSVAGKGTTIRYTLSEAATVRFWLTRLAAGRRVGASCRRPTAANRGRRACTRRVAAGTFSRRSATGATALRFAGRIRGKGLAVGRHELTLRATDAAGNRSGARTVRLRVVRR